MFKRINLFDIRKLKMNHFFIFMGSLQCYSALFHCGAFSHMFFYGTITVYFKSTNIPYSMTKKMIFTWLHFNMIVYFRHYTTTSNFAMTCQLISGGARAGLYGTIAPSETCLAPAQPHQGFPNDFPVF